MAGAVASLAVRISGQIAELQRTMKDGLKAVNDFGNGFEASATRASAAGNLIANAVTKLASVVTRELGQALSDSVRLSSEFSNAFIGLSSVARAFGTDAGEASDAAKALASDGLLPVKDAATGLKNLLAAGFSLPEAIKLMNAFKDSAAFGRSGALSFGDAVRSATEGVKNGNSTLVDNAGVTKNLSNILVEAGFSAQDLSKATSDASVRQALFKGILKETAAQAGDASRLTQTYTGQVSRLDSQYKTFLASIGDAITKNAAVSVAIGAVGDAFKALTSSMNNNGAASNFVTEAVILLAKTLAGLLRVVDVVQQGLGAFDTVLDSLVKSVADTANSITTLLIGIVNVALKVPGSSIAIGAYASELRSLALVQVESAKISKLMGERIDDNGRTTNRWSEGIGRATGVLDALVKKLEATRGKTVDVGGAQNDLNTTLDRGSTAMGKATKTSEDYSHALDLIKIAMGHLKAEADLQEASWKRASAAVGVFLQNIPNAIFQTRNLSGIVPTINAPTSTAVGKPAGFLASLFGGANFGQAISSSILSAIQGGGSVLGAAGSTIGSTLTSGIAKTITSGAGLAISGALGGAINAILPGVGALFGPLLEKVVGLFGFGTAGRDLVKDFAASFREFHLDTLQFDPGGGFDQLHKKLQELGADGERLWIALTQGVGRNNPQQAAAVIDIIKQKLGEHKAALNDVAKAAEEAGTKESEAMTRAKSAVEELNSKIKGLQESIKDEAPEEVMGIIESNTRAQIAALQDQQKAAQNSLETMMAAAKTAADQAIDDLNDREIRIPVHFDFDKFEIPGGIPTFGRGGVVHSPTLAILGESGPEVVTPLGSHGLGMGGGFNITVISQLDGREVARNQVRHIPDVLSGMGIH